MFALFLAISVLKLCFLLSRFLCNCSFVVGDDAACDKGCWLLFDRVCRWCFVDVLVDVQGQALRLFFIWKWWKHYSHCKFLTSFQVLLQLFSVLVCRVSDKVSDSVSLEIKMLLRLFFQFVGFTRLVLVFLSVEIKVLLRLFFQFERFIRLALVWWLRWCLHYL